MRFVWPTSFQLFYLPVIEAARYGTGRAARDKYFKQNKEAYPIPVILRWSTHPNLGFPRQPFDVWRRLRRPVALKSLFAGPTTVSGSTIIFWFSTFADQIYEIYFDVAPSGSMTVEAVDDTGRAIPGQTATFTSATTGTFRVPGIWMLRATGSGTISNVRGVDCATYANLPDWQRIEVVGLPYKSDEIIPPDYDGKAKQGFVPALAGDAAALVRLDIANLIRLPEPATGVADFPAPAWPSPDPGRYLSGIRDPNPSQLKLITDCLKTSKDIDAGRMQVKYTESLTLDGTRQGNLPGATPDPTKPSKTKVPVVAGAFMAVSGDSYAATALGYGTTDIPDLAAGQSALANTPGIVGRPPVSGFVYDYMVTDAWILPFESSRIELAALAQLRAGPTPPANLSSKLKQIHRPPRRDWHANAAVRLNWDDPGYPQGYAIAASRKPGQSDILNSPRAGLSGGFDAYVSLTPNNPDPATPPDLQRPSFTDLRLDVPFTGVTPSRYMVAVIDVFGQWSGWSPTNYNVAALPLTVPGILSTEFQFTGAAIGSLVPAQLILEAGWDWDDRTPQAIRIDGAFYTPLGSPPAAASVSGLQLKSGAVPTGTLEIRFDAAGEPYIASAHSGKVIRLKTGSEPAIPDDLDSGADKQRRYRVTLNGFTCDFAAASKIGYCLYARGVERVAPLLYSSAGGPKLAYARSPVPPPVTSLAVVNWTAMPDSTNRGRALLKWTKSANAKYVVFQASESQLRQLYTIIPADPPPGSSFVTRATDLQNKIAADPTRALSAFARVNTTSVDDSQLEIDLPGGSSAIFAYQIASVSDANVESDRSAPSFWAVPRLMTPRQPSLLLRNTSGKVNVIALPNGNITPSGYRVFRVHKPYLASDAGLMGPPKILEGDPGWKDHEETMLHGEPSLFGKSIIDAAATPSWYPYFYRVMALGPQNTSEGEYQGESQHSIVQSALLPPDLYLKFLGASQGGGYIVFDFSAHIPLTAVPAGVAKIEVFSVGPDNPANPTKIVRTLVLSRAANSINSGISYPVIPNPPAVALAALPVIEYTATSGGKTTFYVAMRSKQKQTRVIRVTDPLSRTIEVEFEA